MRVETLPPVKGLYFEDMEIGQWYASPRATVTEDAIIRFALEWDPVGFHIDKAGANSSIFGQLVGSGLHTLVMTSRMIYDSGIVRGTMLAGLGMDDLKYTKPLLPGDTIGAISEIIEKNETSKPSRGRVKMRVDTINQRGEVILSHTREMLIACRSTGDGGPLRG